MNEKSLRKYDQEIYKCIQSEERRQEEHLELIASENFVSKNILEAQGSVLTNKYAEGYPGKRYYGGCEYVDIAENLAINRAKELFNADYVNVQPHSGSSANLIAFAALLNIGDTILGMSLNEGGHLTHGASVNFSGKFYNAVQYGVDSQGFIDYNEVEELAIKHKPKLIIAGFSAYSQIIDWSIFRDIADKVGAYLLVDMSHIAGLVATELYPSPVNIADVTTTTTHKTLRGPRGGLILAKSNIEIEKKINSLTFPGLQGGPLMHVIAAKAIAFKEAMEPGFRVYQEQVLKNTKAMAGVLVDRGYDIVSKDSKNHLILINLSNKKISGKKAELLLSKVNITTNKNSVPNDKESPFVTSGLRIGSPAMTTRGLKEADFMEIANIIADTLEKKYDTLEVKNKVLQLCAKYPLSDI
ncbi:serine hydroxymethyltransferase [Bathymodiolus thermophilus thioautotrophic gill symbiont]|uniref:Serine hydroxymethyltransferase n=1 Tax=Bathymodiolus thermophilus thioautotrophic gill symbiont TaxID=2360 RepID=A0A3G3INB8_9GAMM|nr:serine hydroxymethyltransferase [Bathymodiolus thermophilus thioautotrophic gill symbiont]AYQ57376.1 serine hydroxymethyltransferase [Bathymodiolus thermophilus thioautotrophic gill symbiont]